MARLPVLAIDLGGTKIAAALVDGQTILARREAMTDRTGGVDAWLGTVMRLLEGWDRYGAAGIAATGLIRDGSWRAVNPGTLPVPDDFPLVATLAERLHVPVLACNDAQAAAWGEYRHGAGQGAVTMMFATVSTGIGGGLVLDGRLVQGRTGLAGHLGITPVHSEAGIRMLEELASGTTLESLAMGQGGARAVTAAAAREEGWAIDLLDRVVAPMALALRRLRLELDPDICVIGGGLGLAPAYLRRLHHHLASAPRLMRPNVRAAALGADAGLIGVADLAATTAAAPEDDR